MKDKSKKEIKPTKKAIRAKSKLHAESSSTYPDHHDTDNKLIQAVYLDPDDLSFSFESNENKIIKLNGNKINQAGIELNLNLNSD